MAPFRPCGLLDDVHLTPCIDVRKTAPKYVASKVMSTKCSTAAVVGSELDISSALVQARNGAVGANYILQLLDSFDAHLSRL